MGDYSGELSEIFKIVNEISTEHFFGKKNLSESNNQILGTKIIVKLQNLAKRKNELSSYSTDELMKMKEAADYISYSFRLSKDVFEKKKYLHNTIEQIKSDIITELKIKPDYDEADYNHPPEAEGGRRKTRGKKRKTRGKKRKTHRRRR